jgi:hypothetical protein
MRLDPIPASQTKKIVEISDALIDFGIALLLLESTSLLSRSFFLSLAILSTLWYCSNQRTDTGAELEPGRPKFHA